MSKEIFDVEITDEVFQISIDGAMACQDVSDKISSNPSGNWKKIISMEYNPSIQQVRINYEN
jgi:hypothetical protein